MFSISFRKYRDEKKKQLVYFDDQNVNSLRSRHVTSTAAWLAQLVERQSAVPEVEGSSPRLDQHGTTTRVRDEIPGVVVYLSFHLAFHAYGLGG